MTDWRDEGTALAPRASTSVKNDPKVNCEGRATFKGTTLTECMRRMESAGYGTTLIYMLIPGKPVTVVQVEEQGRWFWARMFRVHDRRRSHSHGGAEAKVVFFVVMVYCVKANKPMLHVTK